MKERVLSRISVNIEAYFIYKNERFTGTVKYLSKKGMYIDTELRLPFRSNIIQTLLKPKIEIFLPFNGNIIKVPLKVRRLVKTDEFYNGIGADVYDPPQEYFELIDSSLKTLQ